MRNPNGDGNHKTQQLYSYGRGGTGHKQEHRQQCSTAGLHLQYPLLILLFNFYLIYYYPKIVKNKWI